MSNKAQLPPTAGLLMVPAESCHCLRCESPIPRECVTDKITARKGGLAVSRSVNAYCAFCDVIYQAVFTLNESRTQWQLVEPTDVVTDATLRKQILARIANVRGDRQLDVVA